MNINNGSIVFDDAGTPGAESKSSFLHDSRKSWCAVVIPDSVATQIDTALSDILSIIKTDYGIDELHFTDIHGGRKKWKNVELSDRIEIIDYITNIMVIFNLPVFYQTISNSFFSDHPSFVPPKFDKKKVWWDFTNLSHLSLYFLCIKVSHQLKEWKDESLEDFSNPFLASIDEGLVKPGVEINLHNFKNEIKDGNLRFERSVDNPRLQLADFAAYFISKAQWEMVKKDMGDAQHDNLLDLMSISGKLNIINLSKLEVSKDISRETYEFQIMRDRMNKNLPIKPNNKL